MSLEDAGYYCVDNLPATLLAGDWSDFLAEAGHERVAVSVDARSAALADAAASTSPSCARRGVDVRVLFLDASDDDAVRRFSETRRRASARRRRARRCAEAIERERALLAGIAALGQRIDTSDLQPRVLQNWIRDLLGLGAGALTLLFESFAYKDGVPLDADFVFDVPLLPNPHYDPQLRPLTGRDAPVVEFLEREAAGRSAGSRTSAASSRAGCPSSCATTAAPSPWRSAAPAAGTARCISPSSWPSASARTGRCWCATAAWRTKPPP